MLELKQLCLRSAFDDDT